MAAKIVLRLPLTSANLLIFNITNYHPWIGEVGEVREVDQEGKSMSGNEVYVSRKSDLSQ